MTTDMFRIPDTLREWPFPRRINPHYDEVSKDSADWTRGFQAFSPTAQKAFDKYNFGLLAALTFPTQNKEQYRAACDIMNLFFVIDDHTDVLDEANVQALADISMNALMNPAKPRPDGESVIGEMTRQFWSRTIPWHATPTSRARFERSWKVYLDSVVEQARDREEGRIRTVDEYMAVRRLTVGVDPCHAFAALGLSLPEEVHDHPLIRKLRGSITDMILYDNDIISYNKEQASGDDSHNIITITMRENNQDLDKAMAWVASRYEDQMQQALAIWPQALALSSSRQVEEDVIAYIDHVMNWPRGNLCWHFESQRYFGEDGLRVQRDRTVELLPKGVKKGLANCKL